MSVVDYVYNHGEGDVFYLDYCPDEYKCLLYPDLVADYDDNDNVEFEIIQ